ncbi:type II secretion system F family protein [Aeromicrobium sp. CTD01-1L150]|uniref:type II secretion system F family protein n=1 Tax=Aeromicrobium sp. CTD01-1L150 TaxID=3341830 RepID=UPI0035BFC6E8
MIAELAAGAVAGGGLALLVMLLVQPQPGIAATLARLERGGRRSAVTRSAAGERTDGRLDRARESIGARLESEATLRGWQLSRTRTDLAVMNRTLTHHLGTKALLGLAAFIWFPGVITLLGYSNSLGVPIVVAVVAGFVGFMLPDLQLHRDAESRRRDFRHVVGSFLDLVAMNLAGGRGLPEALMAASSFGGHWAMVRLRQALSNARIMGLTPWESIARLGEDLGVEELRDLASALALAGDEGARIRTSLMARAESMRRKELVDVEGAAGESSQSMLLAQLLMCIAFLVFLSYPAVSQLGS